MISSSLGWARVPSSPRLQLAAGCLAVLAGVQPAAASELPEIRLTKTNTVPVCATPDRLMAFLKRRNATLAPRFRDIASHYKTHGERWGVRWDYAFFQMAIETNFLTYRAPSGRMGDVDPKQNNFAGIGTTGGGVPGDSFPDVTTGVLGQIQHLVAYSGEMVPNPVAPRTQLKQEHILAKSRELNRPVRFSDLSKRWAVDPKYGNSIEWVAQRFRTEFCPTGRQEAEVLPWQRNSEAKPSEVKTEGSAVRTVWRSDQARASVAAAPTPPRKPVAKAAVADLAPQPQQQSVPEASTAPTENANMPSPPDARFAFFSPPAALAEAKAPKRAQAVAVVAREPAGPPPPPDDVMGPHPAGDQGAAAAAVLPAPPQDETPTATVLASKSPFLPPSGLGVKPGRCVVESASFAGDTTVLVKSPVGSDIHYIALSVLDGFEASMAKSFLDARPQGGETVGTYPTKEAALAHARTLCPQ